MQENGSQGKSTGKEWVFHDKNRETSSGNRRFSSERKGVMVKEDVTQDGDVERDIEPDHFGETEGNRGAGPTRVLLIEADPRAAILIAEMLRAGWPGGLVLAQAETLIDATRELLEHGTGSVLLDLSLSTDD